MAMCRASTLRGEIDDMRISNPDAWAICRLNRRAWKVRRIVWGRLLARAEKRPGEVVMKVRLSLEAEKIEMTVHESQS